MRRIDRGCAVAALLPAMLSLSWFWNLSGQLPIILTTRGAAAATEPPVLSGSNPHWTIPGEFEGPETVILAGHELHLYPEFFADLVDVMRDHASILVLVCDSDEQEALEQILGEKGLPQGSVNFLEVAQNTLWVRDYGPLILRSAAGDLSFLDAAYGDSERTNDDRVPVLLGDILGVPVGSIPLEIEGGNLLSNGEGLCIGTEALLEANPDHEPQQLVSLLGEVLGCWNTVFLEPLAGEPTGHVDMFLAFTGPNAVVVAEYLDQEDEENAEILERNIEVLRQVRHRGRPLVIARLPMPPQDDGVWRTYTNLLFAGDAVLVPVYGGADRRQRDKALAVLSEILPDRWIWPIHAEDIAQSGGALRCISKELPLVGPRFTSQHTGHGSRSTWQGSRG